jgi:hypothetical protein
MQNEHTEKESFTSSSKQTVDSFEMETSSTITVDEGKIQARRRRKEWKQTRCDNGKIFFNNTKDLTGAAVTGYISADHDPRVRR